jgi:cyclic dehypoxanthinyl futalosine synthase
MGISWKDALDCFRSDDLIGIGMEADAVRRRLHPEGVVSYTIDGRINYGSSADGVDSEPICDRIADIVAMGGTGVMLDGEATSTHTIARLRDAGLDSIPGDDAGILDDAVQPQGARVKWKTEDWLAVHRAAHGLGMQTTATMMFGTGETFEHRMNHLEAVRQLQEETGGFASFTPWSFAPQRFAPRGSALNGFEEATAVEYLKTLAISRMYLNNVENVQSHLETQGLKVLQVGLRFGGNDVGSVLFAEGANAATEEQVRQVIRDAGFKPVQRDTLYRTMFLN